MRFSSSAGSLNKDDSRYAGFDVVKNSIADNPLFICQSVASRKFGNDVVTVHRVPLTSRGGLYFRESLAEVLT